MFNFEKLETWQKAIAFADMVYDLTCNFSVGERQGFLSKDNFARLYAAAEEQGKPLSGLRRSVLEG